MHEADLHAETSELSRLRELRSRIETVFQRSQKPYLVASDGTSVELPPSAVEALQLVIGALSDGQAITIVPHDRELTSQEAADILNVSRPHLIKLLDGGEIRFHRVGTHRRLTVEDVLAYRERRDAERHAALSELTRLSEELPGGYR